MSEGTTTTTTTTTIAAANNIDHDNNKDEEKQGRAQREKENTDNCQQNAKRQKNEECCVRSTSTSSSACSTRAMDDEMLAKKLQEEEFALGFVANASTTSTLDQDILNPYKHHQFGNHMQHSTLSPPDLTWNFVKSIIDKHYQISSSSVFPSSMNTTNLTIEPIGIDVMYDVAKRMFECQKEFLENGTSVEVSLAYHYTRDSCVNSIAEQGLNTSKSGTYGAGIYLGNNACAFHGRANVGLIVAILKGKCECIGEGCGHSYQQHMTINTRIGNKSSYKDGPCPNYYDEIVLQDSRQCVPLIKFDASLVDPSGTTEGAAETDSNECIWIYHREMQKIVDHYYNCGVTIGERVTKSDVFPNKSKKYSTLLQLTIPSSSNEKSPTMTTATTTSTAGATTPANNIFAMEQYAKEMYYHNLPMHFFEEEKRDDAVAYLLKNTTKSMSTTFALKLAGFMDFEVSDPRLQKNVKEYVKILRQRSASHKNHNHHPVKTQRAVEIIIKNSSITIRSAMKKATFSDFDLACFVQRLKVLECLALYCPEQELSPHYLNTKATTKNEETKTGSSAAAEQQQQIEEENLLAQQAQHHHYEEDRQQQQQRQRDIDNGLKLCNAAQLLVSDISLPKACALRNAGFSFGEAQNPSLQLKVQQLMCEMSLKVGLVGSSLSTSTSTSTSISKNYDKGGNSSIRNNGAAVPFSFTPQEGSSNNDTLSNKNIYPYSSGGGQATATTTCTSISKMNQAAASLSSRRTIRDSTTTTYMVGDIPHHIGLIILAMEDAGLTREEAMDSRNQIYVKIKANLLEFQYSQINENTK